MESNKTIYLAPIQGITDYIFRKAFTILPGEFDKSFSPFIRVQNATFFRPSQVRDILPENNSGERLVPQFLGNSPEDFFLFEETCLQHGYNEVNINMGCPFPMVTNKGLGAGLLSEPESIKELLEGISGNTKMKISVKCRLGNIYPDELEQCIPIFNSYPLEEIIIHARYAKQMYSGEVNYGLFQNFSDAIKAPVIYNGDINTVEDYNTIIEKFPNIKGVMIGRGCIQNPGLLAQIQGKEITNIKATYLEFYRNFAELCKEKYSGDHAVLKRVVEMWEFHSLNYEDGKQILKHVKKCKNLEAYYTLLHDVL